MQALFINGKNFKKEAKNAFNRIWSNDEMPELSITFLDGCNEEIFTEKAEECIKDCISSVRNYSIFSVIYAEQQNLKDNIDLQIF